MEALFSLLYDMLIAPLAIAYGAAYSLCSRALGYGYGLLALSALTTLLLSPLRKKVAAVQEEERRLRRVIDPQLARIRAESGGEERHARVRRLYRRYGYHPIMSIRAMWGLLLQVPFIFAAYHMLSELSALRLISFWGVASLADPDRLLPGGVNLLPLLMTAFNLAAALLTPGATRKETAQAFVIAGLFLALLYSAPSALLIYWTANNFLSLASVLHERFGRVRGAGDGAEDVVVGAPPALSGSGGGSAAGAGADAIPAAWLTAYAFACATLPIAWASALLGHVKAMRSGESPYYFSFSWVELLLAGLLIAAAVLGAKRARAARANGARAGAGAVAGIVLCLGLSAFIVCGWAVSMKLRTVSGKLFIWSTLICVAAGALAWFTAAGGLTGGLRRLFKREAERSGAMLYWPAAFAVAGLLVLFAPMALYQSAPETFTRPAAAVARELLPYFLCVVYGFLYCSVALSRRGIERLGLLAAYFAVAGAIMALAFPPNGILDGDAFLPDRPGSEWIGMAQDVLCLAAALALLFILARRGAMRHAARGLGVYAAAMAAFCVYVSVSMPDRQDRQDRRAAAGTAAAAERSGGGTELPAVHQRLFSFSPDRPNVLVFIYDQYHGGDIGRMLDEDPAMASRLPGFVWYRDVVSDGNNTLLSFPALLGGPAYTPGAINLRRGRTLADRVVDATAELPRLFLNAGYAVSCCNVGQNLAVDNGVPLSRLAGFAGDRLVDVPQPPEYAVLAREALDAGDGGGADGGDAKLLLAVSLFRSVPNLLRAGLVGLGAFETESSGKVYHDIAVPLLMPRYLAADSKEPTYKIFVSALSHNPFLLGPDSLVPLEKEERRALAKSADAHFYTERHIIAMLESLVARMRAMGVYDNTRIILASDHNYQRDPNPFLRDVTSPFEQMPPRPYALLLVKDFNAGAPLSVSDRLMQGHDMPALACAGLPDIAGAPALPPDDPGRERRHFVGRSNLLHHSGDSFTSLRILLNTGSMFEASNWNYAEQAEQAGQAAGAGERND